MPWDGPGWMAPAGPRGSFHTYDGFTRDSTGAFYIGELERLDQTIHEPLVAVTWGRDIDLREDVTTGDEISSFTNSSFAAAGGINPYGVAWIGKDVNAITGAQLDIGKTPQPLFLWGMELSYTMPELASAMQAGRPIDSQKYDVIRTKHQMDVDQCVYVGDPVVGSKGLLNHASVTNVSNSTAGGWSTVITTNPDAILTDVNTLLQSVWQNSGWAQMPDRLLLPPTEFGLLVSHKVSTAGNISVLRFLQENSLCNSQNGRPLDIQPVKWAVNRGTAATQRMIAYTKQYNRVRFPMTPLQRTPLEWRSLYNLTTYWGRIGMIEIVYPETVGYMDNINPTQAGLVLPA